MIILCYKDGQTNKNTTDLYQSVMKKYQSDDKNPTIWSMYIAWRNMLFQDDFISCNDALQYLFQTVIKNSTTNFIKFAESIVSDLNSYFNMNITKDRITRVFFSFCQTGNVAGSVDISDKDISQMMIKEAKDLKSLQQAIEIGNKLKQRKQMQSLIKGPKKLDTTNPLISVKICKVEKELSISMLETVIKRMSELKLFLDGMEERFKSIIFTLLGIQNKKSNFPIHLNIEDCFTSRNLAVYKKYFSNFFSSNKRNVYEKSKEGNENSIKLIALDFDVQCEEMRELYRQIRSNIETTEHDSIHALQRSEIDAILSIKNYFRRLVFMIEDENNVFHPIGIITFDEPEAPGMTCNVSFYLLQQYQGQGLGTLMIELAMDYMVSQGFHGKLIAFINSLNYPSQVSVKRAGFKLVGKAFDRGFFAYLYEIIL